MKLTEKRETFQYVPLIQNIEALMQNKDVHNEVSTELYGHCW